MIKGVSYSVIIYNINIVTWKNKHNQKNQKSYCLKETKKTPTTTQL